MAEITIFNVNEGESYFVCPRSTAQDETLSWEARGILLYLLSKPNTWKLNPVTLLRDGFKRGQVYDTIRELIAAGYIIREELRESGRISGYKYYIYSKPQPCASFPQAVKQEAEKSHIREYRELDSTEDQSATQLDLALPVKPEPKPRKQKVSTPKPPPTPDDRTQRTSLFNAMYDAANPVLKLNSQTTGAILSKTGKFQAFADEGITVEQATRAGQLLKAWRATPPLDQTVGAIVTLLDTVMNAAKQGITAGDIEAAVKNINNSKSPQFAGILKSVLSEAERVRAEQNRKQPKTTDALIQLGALIKQQQHDRALYVQAMNSPDATGNEASWIKQCDDLIAGYVEKKRELEAELAANNG